jgi:hypothetical protein
MWARTIRSEQDAATELSVLGETERQRAIRRDERRRYNLTQIAKKGVRAADINEAIRRFGPVSEEVQKLLNRRYEATADGFVDKVTGALLLDFAGNPIELSGSASSSMTHY